MALDVSSADAAREIISSLRGLVSTFKIGSQLYTACGPGIVKETIESGAGVFLDLKFHDIPHQVAGAATVATQLGVSMFTLHASGGAEMMKAAASAVAEVSAREKLERPAILAVSVLTSIDATILKQVGIAGTPAEAVERLVKLAESAGVDGVVASPQESGQIRKLFRSEKLLIVTPGIRPESDETISDDQKRVATPGRAFLAGADYLVIGRPITGAKDPLLATRKILEEIERALDLNPEELSRSGSV